ncbi:MAG: hypothetical protein RRZ24_03440 [Clostridia bacterium]
MEQQKTTSVPPVRRCPLPSGGMLYIVQHGTDVDDISNNEAHIVALDDRYEGNPSFQIRESYRVHNAQRKREILDALIAFDRETPTDPPWQRTRDSLYREWKLHNLAYRLHIYRKSARHVDLDNRDEGKGYWHLFVTAGERALEMVWKRLHKGKHA